MVGVQEGMLNLKFGSCSLHRRVSLSLFWLCVSSYLQQIFGKITKVSSLVSSFVIGITGEDRIIQTYKGHSLCDSQNALGPLRVCKIKPHFAVSEMEAL